MQSERFRIEKNTVQETLIIPLYGRKMCSERFPALYSDVFANRLCSKLDYDFSKLERNKKKFLYEFGALEAAMRQLDIMFEIKNYLTKYPKAEIVNLGCGLDETGKACDNGSCRIINVDLPEVIAIREQLIPKQERETNIPCDLKDYAWMDKLDGSNGIFFFAAGVFHYFRKNDVKNLILELSKRFPNGCLVFDSVGKFALKLMVKKVLKNMDIEDVEGFFYVDKPEKDLNWSEKINVSSKGYMLGYYDMKSPGVSFLHRWLAFLADSGMKMTINRMIFL